MASLRDVLSQAELKLEDVQLILQRYPSAVTEMEGGGSSTLHLAVQRPGCSVAIVKLLLNCGADPNFEMNEHTPLYPAMSCKNDRVGVIRAMVEGGSRIDNSFDWCLSVALFRKLEIEVIKLLMSAGGNILRFSFFEESMLFDALRYFDVSVFRRVALDLPNIDIKRVRNASNGSLLHTALGMKGCTPVFVKFLIDKGIDVVSMDKYGNTPLHVAMRKLTCNPEVVDVLLRRGSVVSVRNRKGKTPLDLAIENKCNLNIVQLLLKYCLLENPSFDVEDSFRGNKRKRMFSRYANNCKRELQNMNSEIVGNGRTLFEFLKAYSGKQMKSNDEVGFSVDQLWQIITGKRYRIYSNVISSKLEHSLLKGKLERCHLFTVVESSSDVRVTRKVLLTNDCVGILGNYLDEKDLLNMIMAFCN